MQAENLKLRLQIHFIIVSRIQSVSYSLTILSHGLVTDDQAAFDRILAADNVQIGSADRRQRDANYRFADSCPWTFNFLDANVVHAMENSGPHLPTSGRSPESLFPYRCEVQYHLSPARKPSRPRQRHR